MNRASVSFLMGIILPVLLVCVPPAHPEAKKVRVAVSVPPQAYFVERIGADKVEVQVMLPGQSDHDSYQPTPRQLVRLAQAQMYVRVGVPGFAFEERHIDPLLAERRIRTVNLSDGVRVLDDDPHLWVSPAAVRIAAVNIYRGLAEIDPRNGEFYKKNLVAFTSDIDSLDAEIRSLLQGRQGARFLVFHPALGYFASQYGLQQISIETEGKSPSASHIRRTVEIARARGNKIVLVQKGFDRKNAGAVAAEVKGKLVEIDPLDRDWLRGTRDIARKVSEAAR